VFSPATAFLLAHILADPAARRTGFGEARVFDLGFPVSVKTGTSHDYRDNWAVGFTDEHTVGAWVGNFDGTPMGNISGITGAGPLFAAVVVEVSQDGAAPPAPPGSIVTRRVCPVSGALPGPACPDAREELFVRGREPVAACSIHQLLEVDSRNGLLATESCPEDIVERRAFEVYPASMAVWAQKAGRNVPPPASDLCPQAPRNVGAEPVRILEPPDGAVFALEPDIPPGDQAIEVRFTPPPAGGPVTLLVDGEVAARVDGAPWRVLWGPVAGEHALAAAAAGAAGEPVVVQVE
jgi:penicillin-binding protein 1C